MFKLKYLCLIFIICNSFVNSSSLNDVTILFKKLISNYGFQLLEYTILTDDGYLLTLHRVVPLDYVENVYNLKRKPVILQHGVFGSSNNFFLNGHPGANFSGEDCGNNFGFCLIASGRYDVWSANSRANGYSNGYIDKSRWHNYWEYSFDQMAQYDLPATIDFIRKTTGHSKVGYVGHSQGTVSMFALLVSKFGYKYRNIIQPFIAWGPPAYIYNMTSQVRHIMILEELFEILADLTTLGLANILLEKFCENIPGGERFVCLEFINEMYGKTSSLDMKRLPEWLEFVPNVASTWAVLHFAQLYRSKEFQRFDYGEHFNRKFYNSTKPPKFDLRRFPKQVNVLIFNGKTDGFITQENAHRLWDEIDLKKRHSKFITLEVDGHWNHIDYLFSTKAGPLLYKASLDYLDLF